MEGLVFILLMLTGTTQGQKIITPPANATETIGGTAKLLCEVDYGYLHTETMTWKFNNQIIYSYTDGEVDYPLGTNKYIVTFQDRRFTLEVKNLDYADGGTFTCHVMNSHSAAILIVLGSPIVTQNSPMPVEGDVVEFTCEAPFGGPRKDDISQDQYPQLRMFSADKEFSSYTSTEDDFRLSKVYQIEVNDNMHEKELACEIGTVRPKKRQTSFTSVDVLYSVRNITYSPNETIYEFGSNITCTAKGNPSPSIEWQKKASPKAPIEQKVLPITEGMEGDNTWECIARNIINEKTYTDSITAAFQAVLTIKPAFIQSRTSNNTIVIIVVSSIAGFVAILLFVGYKRAVAIKDSFKGKVTGYFYVIAFVTILGNSFPHGWNTGVLNIPQKFIKAFLNISTTQRYGHELTDFSLEVLWAFCVSVYLLAGSAGVFVAINITEKCGRKKTLLLCNALGLVSALLFGFCKMANSFEMLLIARVIAGFGCGVGSRIALMFLSEIAPQELRNTVLVLHQFGITLGIVISQVLGIRHCLGREAEWPILLALTAVPCMASLVVLPWFPDSPRSVYLMARKEKAKGKCDDALENETNSATGKDNASDKMIIDAPEKETNSATGKDNASDKMINDAPEKETNNATGKDNASDKMINDALEKYQITGENYEDVIQEIKTEEPILSIRNILTKAYSPALITLCSLNLCQQLSGINVVFYYSFNMYEYSGIPEEIAQYALLATGIINVLMTGISIFAKFGHRPLLLGGISVMIISGIFISVALNLQIMYMFIISIITFVAGFALELGSITQVIGRELLEHESRTPAISVASLINWIANFLVALFFPVFQWFTGPNSFFIFVGFLVVFGVYFAIKFDEPPLAVKTNEKNPKEAKDQTELGQLNPQK